MHLKKPYIVYDKGKSQIEPSVAEEGHTERPTVERTDYVSADGTKLSYQVGARTLFEVTFRWQTDALKAEWLTFWEYARDGSPFTYVMDDSVTRYGSGTLYGSGLLYGEDSDGDAITETEYTLENVDFPVSEEEVYGYWRIGPLIMREVV